jgi:hypothetical protein
MYPVWTSVSVKNPDHPRFGTIAASGSVHQTNSATHPDDVVVKFDSDGLDANGVPTPGSEESIALADLTRL